MQKTRKKQNKSYILYMLNQKVNDLVYIKEYKSIKEIEQEFNLKSRSAYHYITKDINNINNNLLKCKYTIIEDKY